MLARGLPGLTRRFAGLTRGVPGRLAGFTGGVAGFDGGLTRYARFGSFALQGCPCHECRVRANEYSNFVGSLGLKV